MPWPRKPKTTRVSWSRKSPLRKMPPQPPQLADSDGVGAPETAGAAEHGGADDAEVEVEVEGVALLRQPGLIDQRDAPGIGVRRDDGGLPRGCTGAARPAADEADAPRVPAVLAADHHRLEHEAAAEVVLRVGQVRRARAADDVDADADVGGQDQRRLADGVVDETKRPAADREARRVADARAVREGGLGDRARRRRTGRTRAVACVRAPVSGAPAYTTGAGAGGDVGTAATSGVDAGASGAGSRPGSPSGSAIGPAPGLAGAAGATSARPVWVQARRTRAGATGRAPARVPSMQKSGRRDNHPRRTSAGPDPGGSRGARPLRDVCRFAVKQAPAGQARPAGRCARVFGRGTLAFQAVRKLRVRSRSPPADVLRGRARVGGPPRRGLSARRRRPACRHHGRSPC